MSEKQSEYETWIREHVPDLAAACMRCGEVSREMRAAFPELRLVRGHYICLILREELPHWWLVTHDGRVVDPTAIQFPSNGNGEYIPRDESQPEPTGRCYNCGNLCFDGSACCSTDCHVEYRAFCMGQTD